MQGCTAVSVIQVRIMGGQVCDLVYAATEKQYQGCKLLQLLMAWLELQLAKVCLLSTAVASMSQG